MRKTLLIVIIFSFFLSFYQLSWAKKEKTGKVENDILVDEKFGYQLNVLSNWKIKLEKEPSLVRSTLTMKNYPVSTISEGDRLIPTIVICADTNSLSLKQVEDYLIMDKGNFGNKDEYLKNLEAIATYELINKADIALDSIASKVYAFKKSYIRQLTDPSERYGPEGSDIVTREDHLISEIVILKKENNLYIIQLSGDWEHFTLYETEFSKMLETWKFLK